MTRTSPPATPTTDRTAEREAARRQRVVGIQAGATVRAALGQAAQHELTPDGQHVVRLRGMIGVGATVAEAIENIREEART